MSGERRRLSRRAFVALGGASVLAGAGAWRLLGDGDDGREAHRVALRVAGAFTDLAAAQAVGAAYLGANPRARDERRLVSQLRRANPDWGRVAQPPAVRRLARTEARRDYAAGRLATVGGWYLSLTEARMCALATFVRRA